ncbi:hypothetical protein LYSIN_01856 [Lysinibacillus sphaericus]|uniref:Uncharacterized protein n=1 Tax=Lysinibacillus sphaericus TaxID=1421 RepID=A0A2S5D1X6_LYSSH|nr:hypothetical protein [Lysinibacillus sphaericus]POZ57073.1 hypothetical protein LYSIN_01856 [Lysinibacillus sphaericus]
MSILLWESAPLSNRDLNIPSNDNTHLTGQINLDAGKNLIPNFQTYFRNTVFNTLAWDHKRRQFPHIEYADCDFEVLLEGHNIGNFTLELVHSTDFTSKTALQNNAMTKIKWGSLRHHIGNPNYLNKTLKIYRTNSIPYTYLLEIS